MAGTRRQDRHTYTARPVSGPGLGFGLVDVTVRTPDGREFTERAWGERTAYLRALAAYRTEQERQEDGERARSL